MLRLCGLVTPHGNAMSVVDTHCHVSPHWLEPIDTLLGHMERAQVEHAVLTCTVYSTDSQYEEECVRQFPGKFGYVGAVQPASPEVGDAVRSLVKRGASGIRMRASAVEAAMDGALTVLSAAADSDTTLTLLGTCAEFTSSSFFHFLDRASDVRIVVEHLGSSMQAGEEGEDQRRKVFGLAQYPALHMKFHGLGEFCKRKANPYGPFPFEEPVPPYLEMAYHAFGPKRLLWGSDFPNVSSREGYENSLKLPRASFAHLPVSELDDMFGGNALRLFPMP